LHQAYRVAAAAPDGLPDSTGVAAFPDRVRGVNRPPLGNDVVLSKVVNGRDKWQVMVDFGRLD